MLATLMTNRTRRSEWPLSPCTHVGMLVALAIGWLSAGCIVLPTKAEVAVSGDMPTPSGGIALSVLFSRDFSPETDRSLGEKMVECITRGLAEAAPEVRLVPEEEFYRAIFGLKPDEVMLQTDTIGTLLARPDIRQRVGESGLTHLILVSGATNLAAGVVRSIGQGFFESAATRSTQLTASLFELASGQVGHVQVSAAGSQGSVSTLIFFLSVGWVPRTESAACQALGAEVARAISGRPRDENR